MISFAHPAKGRSAALAGLAVCCLAALPARAQTLPDAQPLEVLDPKKAAKLVVKREVPEYPPLAKMNFIQGAVRMVVKVTSEGQIAEAHVLGGHPFLALAALDAIRKWIFRPAKARPGPAEFQTYVDVNFSLHFKKLEHLPSQPEQDLLRQVHPPELMEKPADSAAAETVRLRLLIDADGTVTDSQPLAGLATNLEEARDNVSHWKFRPAHWGTVAVPWYFDADVPVQGWRATRSAADPGGQ